MYVLTKISDIIPLAPTSFSRPTHEALEDAINAKYANKVLHNTGLCICVYDMEKIDDGMIRPGDGAAYVKCVFRLIVFRPFIGEVLVGWISSCTEQGINVKMEFFNDIHIPKSMLFEDCHFIPSEQAWIWKLGDDKLYLDVNEKIRFRVEKELFTEQHPAKPGAAEDQPKQAPPYAIVGSCQTDGMGLVTWW